jgi:hypothetical protein
MSNVGSQPSRIVPVFKSRKDSTQTKGLDGQLQRGLDRQKQQSTSHTVSVVYTVLLLLFLLNIH